MMLRGRILALAAATVVVVGSAVWVAYERGVEVGYQQGLGAADSHHGVTTGTQALFLLNALEAGDHERVERGLDLLVDVGISSHYLHLLVPERMGGTPNQNQQWLYQRLIDHRRQIASSVGPTEHIGPQVAAALESSR